MSLQVYEMPLQSILSQCQHIAPFGIKVKNFILIASIWLSGTVNLQVINNKRASQNIRKWCHFDVDTLNKMNKMHQGIKEGIILCTSFEVRWI